MRKSPKGFMFETKGAALLPVSEKQSSFLLGLLNSSVVNEMQSFISPTLDYHEGPLGKIPVLTDETLASDIALSTDECTDISKTDYDSFEISWDFKRHPLV